MAQDNKIPAWQVGLAAQQLYAQLSLATNEGDLALLLQQTDCVLDAGHIGTSAASEGRIAINYRSSNINGSPTVSVSFEIGQGATPLRVNYHSSGWGSLVLMTACERRIEIMTEGHVNLEGNFVQSKTISPASYKELRKVLIELSALASQSRQQ